MTTTAAPRIGAELEGTWLTWVGAVTGCLKALGVTCDTADVAGFSGYAFRITVHRELCPSGPTVFDWQTLLQGVWKLGRSTVAFCGGFECHTKETASDRSRAHCRAGFDLAKRETDAGRPCVIWGAYVPEFAVCVGTTADEEYLVDSCRKHMGQSQPPVRWDQLNAPGGVYTLGFPTATKGLTPEADRDAVRKAAESMAESHAVGPYAFGGAAYGLWINAIQEKRIAAGFGAGYNATCWWDARRLAAMFMERLAARNQSPAKPHLTRAATALGETAAALAQVLEVFPFPGGKEPPTGLERAIEPLRAAQAADAAALGAMREAVRVWDEKQLAGVPVNRDLKLS